MTLACWEFASRPLAGKNTHPIGRYKRAFLLKRLPQTPRRAVFPKQA